jgi:hypothetical protein
MAVKDHPGVIQRDGFARCCDQVAGDAIALMICCPETGKTIPVGIADPLSFARIPDFVSIVYCPFCNLDHRWSRADAWFDIRGQST